MYNEKNILFSVGLVLLAGVLYAAFKESGLQTNTQTQIKIYEKDHPNLDSIERALHKLEQVDYAAIVYIQETTLHGDSWFGRNIFGPEHWHASSKTKVLYTIMGKEHPTILYGRYQDTCLTMRFLWPYAILTFYMNQMLPM